MPLKRSGALFLFHPCLPAADVPLAWRLLWEGFGWPLRAFADYKNGSLMEADANITGEPSRPDAAGPGLVGAIGLAAAAATAMQRPGRSFGPLSGRKHLTTPRYPHATPAVSPR